MGVRSLLLPRGFQELNLGCQLGKQVPLPTEASLTFLLFFLINLKCYSVLRNNLPRVEIDFESLKNTVI